MILDPHEKIFLVPMGDRKGKPIYAQFRFKPYFQIQDMLDNYNIPYDMSDERFKHKLLINSNIQGYIWYRVPDTTDSEKEYHQFMFTSDIIDKIFMRYRIDYEKKEDKEWKKIIV